MRARPLAAALGAGLGIGVFASTWAEPTSLASEIKATYIDKFGDFVDWPASALGASTDPVRLCVVGDDPFGPVLDQATRGQRIGARPVVVVRLDKIERGMPCHILFVAGSNKQSVADALSKVRGDPVLTITDAAPAPAAGMINFVVLGNRVRFQIDETSATQSGLMISSKLLSLAVKPEE
jgi:hypothetical protein